jgi:hypothetical protein
MGDQDSKEMALAELKNKDLFFLLSAKPSFFGVRPRAFLERGLLAKARVMKTPFSFTYHGSISYLYKKIPNIKRAPKTHETA